MRKAMETKSDPGTTHLLAILPNCVSSIRGTRTNRFDVVPLTGRVLRCVKQVNKQTATHLSDIFKYDIDSYMHNMEQFCIELFPRWIEFSKINDYHPRIIIQSSISWQWAALLELRDIQSSQKFKAK